jgi:serine/threonine protein phosphatase PrpC
MSGIRETRKKLQRSIIYIAQCGDSHAALRELRALRLTVESQIELLENQLRKEEESHATNTEGNTKETDVTQAASQGFNTIFEADGCARGECV